MLGLKGVAIDLSGLDAIDSATKSRAITLKAVKAGAKVIQRVMKSTAPQASGALAGSIGIKAVKGTKGKTSALAVIGARKKVVKMVTRPGRRTATKAVPAFYFHLQDQGTKPHAVGKGSKAGRSGKPPGPQSGGMHPGTKATRFAQSAFETTKDEAAAAGTAVMESEVAKVIAKAAAKLAGGKK